MVVCVKFGSLVDFVSSPTPAGNALLETYISTDNMLPDFNGVTTATQLPKSGNIRQFQVGDTLFSNIRTYFRKVWGASFNGTCSPDVLLLRSKDSRVLNAKFLEYICKWDVFTEHTVKTSRGAKMPRGDKAAIADFEFPLPDLQYQENVAEILASLDDKIELNRRMNEVLEGMARAVFRDWFVDFGPTRRKMAGEADPVKILGGAILAPAQAQKTAALFPDRLGENGLPEGWEMGTLGDFATLNPESWSAKNHPNKVSYVDLANTKWGNIQETTEYEWRDAPSRARRIIKRGDTIVGTVRPGNGSYSFVGIDGLTASTGFAVLRPKQADFEEFVYCASTSSENIENLTNLADGGAYPAVRPDVVLKTSCVLVDEKQVKAFSLLAQPMFQKMEQAKQENQTLAEMRDLLLPKLMSGEIRLREGG